MIPWVQVYVCPVLCLGQGIKLYPWRMNRQPKGFSCTRSLDQFFKCLFCRRLNNIVQAMPLKLYVVNFKNFITKL